MNARVLATRWAALAPRERVLVAAAASVLGLALLWWVALAPAIATLRGAEAAHRTLDAQLERVRRLQAQAQAMQAQPRQNPEEAMRQMEQAIRQQLGSAGRYSIAGDRVTLTLTGVPSPVLAQWLAQVRVNARAVPAEARLNRNAAGTWDGTLVLTLPAR